MTLTAEKLRELIHYDPETGAFAWRKSHRGVRPGKCGRISKRSGYRDICIDYTLYRSHRLAFLYMTGKWPTKDIDHKNRIRSDNRWSNLREATSTQNSANVSVKTTNTTGFIGVVWDKARNKWRAQIRIDGRKTNLGRFDQIEDAIKRHDIAAIEAFGEFAQTNNPRETYA